MTAIFCNFSFFSLFPRCLLFIFFTLFGFKINALNFCFCCSCFFLETYFPPFWRFSCWLEKPNVKVMELKLCVSACCWLSCVFHATVQQNWFIDWLRFFVIRSQEKTYFRIALHLVYSKWIRQIIWHKIYAFFLLFDWA